MAGRSDIEQLFGELNPATIAEILALRPTPSELEEASAWLAGDGDVPAQQGHPLLGKTARIVDLVQRGSDERD